MLIPKFEHQFNQASYDKALTKFMKALETDNGKKFITHLVKAFIHSGTIRALDTKIGEDGKEVEFVNCDVTHAKLCTKKAMDNFLSIVELRLNQFPRIEGETDEIYDKRQEAYYEALRSSNPYAIDKCVGYTADKTDKVLSIEAITALTNLYNQIKDEQEKYPDLWNVVRPFVKKPAPKKNFKKQRNNRQPKGQTLADAPGMAEAIAKLKGEE